MERKIKSAISFENITVAIMMLVVFGSFYILVLGKIKTQNGFIFAVYPQFKTLTCYIFFILFEVLFYFIVMGTDARQYKFYWIVLAELILIPLYKMGEWNDFCMRGSIAPLFLFMVLCVQYLFDKNPPAKKDQKCFAVCLVIGFLTSLQRYNVMFPAHYLCQKMNIFVILYIRLVPYNYRI